MKLCRRLSGALTLGADAKEDKVIAVDLVAGIFFEAGQHRGDHCMVNDFDFVTRLAYEVVVGLLARQFIDYLVALYMGCGYQAKTDEKF